MFKSRTQHCCLVGSSDLESHWCCYSPKIHRTLTPDSPRLTRLQEAEGITKCYPNPSHLHSLACEVVSRQGSPWCSPKHPRFFGLDDVEEHKQGVEHVVSALNSEEKKGEMTSLRRKVTLENDIRKHLPEGGCWPECFPSVN